MNKAALLLKGRRLIAKSGLLLRKHSHEILTYGGIVGGIGAAVLACKATLKLEDTLDEGKDNITYVKESFENVEEPTKEERKEYLNGSFAITNEELYQKLFDEDGMLKPF